jgi:hypothetical protein
MRSASTIPQSQKPRIRAIARTEWIRSGCEFDVACLNISQRISQDVGGAWVLEATEIAKAFCVYWDQNRILEPAAVAVLGEPGNDYFESDEES